MYHTNSRTPTFAALPSVIDRPLGVSKRSLLSIHRE
jgi:hypothetical protein